MPLRSLTEIKISQGLFFAAGEISMGFPAYALHFHDISLIIFLLLL